MKPLDILNILGSSRQSDLTIEINCLGSNVIYVGQKTGTEQITEPVGKIYIIEHLEYLEFNLYGNDSYNFIHTGTAYITLYHQYKNLIGVIELNGNIIYQN